jgi:hypothetical protein
MRPWTLTRIFKIIAQGGRKTYYAHDQLLPLSFPSNYILQSRLEMPDIVNWAPANLACCPAAKLKARLLPKIDKYTWQGHHLAMPSVTGRGYASESSKQAYI